MAYIGQKFVVMTASRPGSPRGGCYWRARDRTDRGGLGDEAGATGVARASGQTDECRTEGECCEKLTHCVL